MVERNQFKTKLCVMFMQGRCPRRTCKYAHGNAELRRFSKSFNGRQDHRGGDLREMIVRRRSPVRRYSPGRDPRAQRSFQGYSPARFHGKRSDRNQRERQLDAQSDFSGSLKNSDGAENQVKDKRSRSSDSQDTLGEQLRRVQSEIDLMEDHKTRLQIFLEEKVEEADTLSSRVKELEIQLSKEKEECRRILSKTKKFIKAHHRHSRIQEDLLRSQSRLQKLGEELGINEEEDAKINNLSDGDTVANHLMGSQADLRKIGSPNKKRQRIQEGKWDEQSRQGEGLMLETFRPEKRLHLDAHNHAQFNEDKEAAVKVNRNNGWGPTKEGKIKLGKNSYIDTPSDRKLKVSKLVDEEVEVGEMDKKCEVVGNSSATIEERGVAYDVQGVPLSLPPPPPLPKNAYLQCLKYPGDDENVDVDGLEEGIMDADII